ncbi:cobalamin-independent methionine synthase II family protein [Streptococcus sp. IsoGale021]|uniref:cobalamin-independent methionine synthase II family protein n=1 Tax=Streptococcus TaxID=1301 RepID=UPI0020008059|nr:MULTISPECIES: cobalamin-independent methionine synthase II family protein [Streptococcus]MCY7209709.1 cobalamin-independent methionine synthase II family protein [Streptococcus anginosus]MCY7211538.1 cobalamin-independent methionine synthase II family protein [Streptococcus anginosus]MCY7226665.1 cobalamin-independent methionine synthase II family protein [Streptococcus anginosus]MDQ8693775.1 cobalamin-independent methionine synthase II family protein [Streptococcus sp. IsoGale021]MDU512906
MTQSKFQLVGSLLRPANLLAYKNKIEHRDDIRYPFYDNFPGYHETEIAAIKKVIADEKANGIDILTDGEYSKSMWHLDFIWGLKGIERYIADHGYTFQDHDGGQYETRKDIGIRISQPLSGKNHHFLDIYKLLKEEAGDTQTKLTIWGPAHAYTELAIFDGLAGDDQVYKTNEELKTGLIKAYKEFLAEYKEDGGEIIQFDDCLWELFDESNPASFFADGNAALADLADEFIAINNEVADYGHQLGLKVWTHNCRGNYESRSASGGTYEAIAEKFLRDQHYDRFFLEWDSDVSGDLKALASLKDKDAEVVLGLLSSKTTDLDDEERVLRLLEQASTILPKDRLLLSHQCGFASCDSGNELAIPQQWAKIKQGQEIAKKFWD